MGVSKQEIAEALAKLPSNPTVEDAKRLQRELTAKNGGKPVPMEYTRTVERTVVETERTWVSRRGGRA
jgi:hypothetical protein